MNSAEQFNLFQNKKGNGGLSMKIHKLYKCVLRKFFFVGREDKPGEPNGAGKPTSLPSSKLTWQWKITIVRRKYIFIHVCFSIVTLFFGDF